MAIIKSRLSRDYPFGEEIPLQKDRRARACRLQPNLIHSSRDQPKADLHIPGGRHGTTRLSSSPAGLAAGVRLGSTEPRHGRLLNRVDVAVAHPVRLLRVEGDVPDREVHDLVAFWRVRLRDRSVEAVGRLEDGEHASIPEDTVPDLAVRVEVALGVVPCDVAALDGLVAVLCAQLVGRDEGAGGVHLRLGRPAHLLGQLIHALDLELGFDFALAVGHDDVGRVVGLGDLRLRDGLRLDLGAFLASADRGDHGDDDVTTVFHSVFLHASTIYFDFRMGEDVR